MKGLGWRIVVAVVLGLWVYTMVPSVRLQLATGWFAAFSLPLRVLIAASAGLAIGLMWVRGGPWTRPRAAGMFFITTVYIVGLLTLDFDKAMESSMTAHQIEIVPMAGLRLTALIVAAWLLWT